MAKLVEICCTEQQVMTINFSFELTVIFNLVDILSEIFLDSP